MSFLKKINRKTLFINCIFFAFAVLMLFAIEMKQNYHVDETLTFSRANNVGYRGVTFEEGVSYKPSELFNSIFAVEQGEQFNYSNVLLNAADNVHPPFYFILIHTISSFIPGIYTRWIAGIINIIFALLSAAGVRKLTLLVSGDEMITDAVTILYCFSAGIISMVTFFRMYVMGLCFVTWFLYVLITIYKQGISCRYAVYLLLTSLGAVLTQYFNCIVIFFICVFTGIVLLGEKRYKLLLQLIGTMVAMLGTATILFHDMWRQMFSGDYTPGGKGGTLISYLQTAASKIYKYYGILDNFWYGGLFGIVILSMILIYLFSVKERSFSQTAEKTEIQSIYFILFGASLLSFLLIAIIAPYRTDRYISAMSSMLMVAIFTLIFRFVKNNFQLKVNRAIIALIIALFIIQSWRTNGFEYMYLDSKDIISTAKQETNGKDAVYIVSQGNWKINSNWRDMSYLGSVTFVYQDNLEMLDSLDIEDKYDLVVYVMDNDDSANLVTEIGERYGYASGKYLYSYGYTDTYLLTRYSPDNS